MLPRRSDSRRARLGTVGGVNQPGPSREQPVAIAYPGQRLGRPEKGSGSVARWGRRIAALVINWVASMLVVGLVIGHQQWAAQDPSGWRSLLTMLVFLVEATVLTALVGGSFGQLATRIMVARVDGRPVNFAQSLVRTFLICLVVPPLVFNRDQRGLHDLATGTLAVLR